jgi:hypothetical protein
MQLARLFSTVGTLAIWLNVASMLDCVRAFVVVSPDAIVTHHNQQRNTATARTPVSAASSDNSNGDSSDAIVARRIVVKGDVQGGYYRTCVLNEVRYMRRYS